MTDAESYMLLAIEEAKKAKQDGELPFGAVVVRSGKVIAQGRCREGSEKNVAAHAELQAVVEACKVLGGTDLSDCEIYCTNEPCLMCAGAIFQADIPKVFIGVSRDELPQLLRPRKIRIDDLAKDSRHDPQIVKGIMKEAVLELFKGIERRQ